MNNQYYYDKDSKIMYKCNIESTILKLTPVEITKGLGKEKTDIDGWVDDDGNVYNDDFERISKNEWLTYEFVERYYTWIITGSNTEVSENTVDINNSVHQTEDSIIEFCQMLGIEIEEV